MTDKEEILVKRVGCIAQVVISIIRKYPEINSREIIASKVGMTRRTVAPIMQHLIDINVINEQGCKFTLKNRLTVQPETEWKLQ